LKFASPYYPPRARWYSAVLGTGNGWRRRLALRGLHVPRGISFLHLIGSLLIPGMGFLVRGPFVLGVAALAAAALFLSVFVVGLGFPAGNVAFGMLLSLHASGIAHFCSPWMEGARLRARILVSLMSLFAVGALLYAPSRGMIERRWLMPLRINGRVIVVRHLATPRLVKPGDWVAFHLEEFSGGDFVALEGTGYGPLLAGPGDHVRFTPLVCEINGRAIGRLDDMPVMGELVVPEKHWFVWPTFGIQGYGHGAIPDLGAIKSRMAMMPQEQFIGKAFKRWFWRRQIVS